jgi:hypothetical protein
MIKIISAIGKEINFLIETKKEIVISHLSPVEVSDLEFNVLFERLGSQISKVESEETTQQTAEVVPTVNVTPEVEVPTESIDIVSPETPIETAPITEETTQQTAEVAPTVEVTNNAPAL